MSESNTSTTPPRQCPECGSDRWKMREAERNYERCFTAMEDAEKIARENGLLRYRAAIAERDHIDHIKRLQRKIARQAKVIVRMEAKLREAGQKPYEGAPLGESAPAAEYDVHGGDA